MLRACMQLLQVLQVPQEDVEAVSGKTGVDARAHSFLPPLLDIKQIQEKLQKDVSL